ncbi:MAG: hypothetical protein A4S09_04790 [Proteobacteria bacterium SG_bin7]|nr:MAG: hypothetical protein A4S09_04790 [Proteobacteria bacterium SG_bin7]
MNPDEIGAATDDVDQLLLSLAQLNKAYLATHENTMTVGQKSLPPGRVHRFEDLVLDLIDRGALDEEDVDSRLRALDHYGEILDSSRRAQIVSKAKPKDEEE